MNHTIDPMPINLYEKGNAEAKGSRVKLRLLYGDIIIYDGVIAK